MSEPCCREGHPLTAADLLKWRQREARLAEAEFALAILNKEREWAQTRLVEAEQLLREFIALNLLHDERDRAAVRRFLSKADSASEEGE